MNRITAKRIYSLIGISCTLLLNSFFISCAKREFNESVGDAQVSVNVSMQYDEEKGEGRAMPTDINANRQVVEIPWSEGKILRAELMSGKNNRVATQSPLPAGTLYRVVVYTSNGSYIDQKLFTVGAEASAGSFLLDGNTPYIFIAYSYGKNVDPGAAPNAALSTNPVLPNISLTDTYNNSWLYLKKTVTPTSGQNNISLVMKNLLSQITATVDASAIGTITELSGRIGGNYSSLTSVKLNDGTFTTSGTAQSRNFNFPAIGQVRVISNPLNYYNGSSDTFPIYLTITAGGKRKVNESIGSFTLKPGWQYNLKITFITSEIIVGDLIWAKGNLTYDNGIYYNRINPEETGYDYKLTDYWNYASPEEILRPAMNTTYQAETPEIQLPLNDPCKLIDGGLWRMPTLADFKSLGALTVVNQSGVENTELTGQQPNGLGSSSTGTKDPAGYIYFYGTDSQSGQQVKLKFFPGGGLRGAVVNNVPLSEPDISTFRNFDVIYHASDAQDPDPGTSDNGVDAQYKGYLYAPPTFVTLNENNDRRFNFLSFRYVHTKLVNDDVKPRRDSRFPIRCVKSRL